MRFMVIVNATPESEAGVMPSAEEMEAMTVFNEGLAKDGVLLAAEGLRPTSQGARIRFGPGAPTVTDGPFTESKEIVGGYCVMNVRSKEEAVAWTKRFLDIAGPGVCEFHEVFAG